MTLVSEQVIDQWIDSNWENIVASISQLVSIPSTEDRAAACPEQSAPFGPGPRAALTAVLELASELGLR